MIDVEQRPLRALEQDALALAPAIVKQRPDPIHIGQHPRGDLRELLEHGLFLNRLESEPTPQRVVMDQDPRVRANRIGFLGRLHGTMNRIADLSKLAT